MPNAIKNVRTRSQNAQNRSPIIVTPQKTHKNAKYSRGRIFAYVMAEVSLIALAGILCSGLLTYGLVSLLAKWLLQSKNIVMDVDVSLLDVRLMCAVFVAALAAGAFAAVRAYKLNAIRILTRGI